MTGKESSMIDKKDTGMLFAQDACHQACLCAQEKHSCVASRMCASSKNVNIPTPPHDWPQTQQGFRKKHKTRGVANGAVGRTTIDTASC